MNMNLKEVFGKKDAGGKPDGKPEGKKQPSEAQRIRRNKMIVFPLMGLLFLGSMWLIFAPSSKDKEKRMQGQGFNTEMPSPDGMGIIGDKGKAYEQARMEEKQKERNHEMQSLASLFGGKADEEPGTDGADYDLLQPETDNRTAGNKAPVSMIRSSATAYHDINRTLGNFYEEQKKPEDDQKQLELEWRIQELERQAEEAEQRKNAADEQLELMEKSYQLAAKYMPGQNGSGQPGKAEAATGESKSAGNVQTVTAPVGQVRKKVVSLLAPPMSDADFVRMYSEPRNMGFNTVQTEVENITKNTIRACVYRTVTLTDGKEVQLRLLEPMMAGEQYIPLGTMVTGTAKVSGERMEIKVSSVSYGESVTPVNLDVYDTKGMKGVFVPESEELNAVKEMAANMGSSLGTSITITEDAGAQLAADLGKGVIQGASQYLAKKFRTVKVTLKANHEFYLLPGK